MTLRVLTLSTLFPDAIRPNFGVFVERQTRELASRDDVDVTVVAPLGMPPWPLSRTTAYRDLNSLPAEERWRDLHLYRPRFTIIPKIGAALHVAMMFRALLPLVRALHRDTPFDVMDASFFYPDGPVAARLAKALGIPFSIKARGADIHYWGRRTETRKAVLAAGQQADGLLAVSDAMKRSMVALGMDADAIRVHYTGVDLGRFQPEDKQAARNELNLGHVPGPVIASVGALIERKGHDLSIRAIAEMPGAHLLIAGAGPEASNLKRLAGSLGILGRVSFLGAVPHQALPSLFNAADVMVLPSSSEGLANAWVESLACGTPVVITDVGGARELVDRPDAGRIVERTPEAIRAGVLEVLATTVDRDAVRETVQRFTWAANGDALREHLMRIAGKA